MMRKNGEAIDRIKHLELGTTEKEQRLNELGIRKIEAEEKDILTHGSDRRELIKENWLNRFKHYKEKKNIQSLVRQRNLN